MKNKLQSTLKIIIISFVIFSYSEKVQSQTCQNLPSSFQSYAKAINAIKNSSFKVVDRLPSGKSSWIISANYYSCDGRSGYLVYKTDKGYEYIHENLPYSVWQQFKTASSSGSYYTSQIKGRYRMIPN